MAEFHVDGDVGIGDLVFASTYWSLPTRQENEYSEYIQNYKGGANEGVTCLNDPVYGTGTIHRLQSAHRSSTNIIPIRSAGRMNCGSSPNRAAGSIGWAAFTGRRPAIRTPAAPTTCRD